MPCFRDRLLCCSSSQRARDSGALCLAVRKLFNTCSDLMVGTDKILFFVKFEIHGLVPYALVNSTFGEDCAFLDPRELIPDQSENVSSLVTRCRFLGENDALFVDLKRVN